jgi:uncharacterized Fe-S center protein
MPVEKLFRMRPGVDTKGGPAQKFQNLLRKAEFTNTIKSGDLVVVKMHFGEPGNIRYIRPIFAVMLVEALIELGARPYVADSVVLYRSQRHTAWDYYRAARRHGFTSEVLGCPIVIAGGMDDRSVKLKVPNPMRLPEVGVPSEFLDADAFISLAHATLHLQYPIGGAIKNLGMGCVDIATKTAMHDARGTEPRQLAQFEATLDGAKTVFSHYKDKFFAINLLLEVTPDCDCWNKSELPIVPDLGIIAGQDPIAVDRASHDLIKAAPGYPGSKLEASDGMKPDGDKVHPIYPKIETEAYFHLAANAGIGTEEYEIEDL